jgi:hypothetical protein
MAEKCAHRRRQASGRDAPLPLFLGRGIGKKRHRLILDVQDSRFSTPLSLPLKAGADRQASRIEFEAFQTAAQKIAKALPCALSQEPSGGIKEH